MIIIRAYNGIVINIQIYRVTSKIYINWSFSQLSWHLVFKIKIYWQLGICFAGHTAYIIAIFSHIHLKNQTITFICQTYAQSEWEDANSEKYKRNLRSEDFSFVVHKNKMLSQFIILGCISEQLPVRYK